MTFTIDAVSEGRGEPVALRGVRFRAEIDWVWVRITLPHPSQFRHVQDRLSKAIGKVYIEPVDSAESSLRFDFKVQDPKGPDSLLKVLQFAVRPGDAPLTEDRVQILGVELAMDGYCEAARVKVVVA